MSQKKMDRRREGGILIEAVYHLSTVSDTYSSTTTVPTEPNITLVYTSLCIKYRHQPIP